MQSNESCNSDCEKINNKCAKAPSKTQQSCEQICKKKALKDAILCMGWMKIVSLLVYLTLFFFVHGHTKGVASAILQIMLWVVMPFVLATAILMFLAAVEDKLVALEISLWLTVMIAAYNTVLGLFGAIYFIRVGTVVIHFFLAVVFGILALSLLTVVCHDVVILYSYRELLHDPGCPTRCSSNSVSTV